MPLTQFPIIKSELHFQVDNLNENRKRGEVEQLYIRKIGILMEIIKAKCRAVYYPG
jgi:hypothetical protein